MQTRIILAVMALPLVYTSAASGQPVEALEKVQRQLTLKRLDGVWVPELLVTRQGAEAYPLVGRRLEFTGAGEFAQYEGKRNVASGTFEIVDGFLQLAVTAHSPWDLEVPEPKKKVRYAFKVDGDLLTLCYTVGDKGRADDLTPGEGRQVVVYKRQREGRGREVPASRRDR